MKYRVARSESRIGKTGDDCFIATDPHPPPRTRPAYHRQALMGRSGFNLQNPFTDALFPMFAVFEIDKVKQIDGCAAPVCRRSDPQATRRKPLYNIVSQCTPFAPRCTIVSIVVRIHQCRSRVVGPDPSHPFKHGPKIVASGVKWSPPLVKDSIVWLLYHCFPSSQADQGCQLRSQEHKGTTGRVRSTRQGMHQIHVDQTSWSEH